MRNLVKLACPKCGCVVFEPQTYLARTTETMTCVPECGHAAPLNEWETAGARSKHRYRNFHIVIAAIAARNTRQQALETERRKAECSYGGGIRLAN
jgi:hypothetical protein